MSYKILILIISCILCAKTSSFGQDTAIFKKNQIGGFVSVNTAWETVEFKAYPLGQRDQLSYGLSFERIFFKRISIETGVSHSLFFGGYYGRQRLFLHHIRMPLIAKYFFYKNAQDNLGIIIGYLPGYFLDKQSSVDRTSIRYQWHYKRYGGFDIITPLAGVEHVRKFNKNILLRTQLKASFQNEAIVAGVLIGLNYYL